MHEPHAGKLARVVLGRGRVSNHSFLFDYCLVKSFKELDSRLNVENITFAKITPHERLERKLIDKEALREALLNALLHNDYANGSAPKVEFFSDRVEITSYGGLPYGITEEEFYRGRSYPRNIELMRVFRDLDLVEHLGLGVPRILKAYGKKAFLITDNYLTVILPFAHGFDEDVHQDVHQDNGILTDNEEKVLELIGQNPHITALDVSETVDISLRHAKRLMSSLKDKGFIIREGSDKMGVWKIINK